MNSKLKYHLKHSFLYLLIFFNAFMIFSLIISFFDVIVFKNYEDFYWGAEILGFWWQSKTHYTVGMLGGIIPFAIALYFAFKKKNNKAYIVYIALISSILFTMLVEHIVNTTS